MWGTGFLQPLQHPGFDSQVWPQGGRLREIAGPANQAPRVTLPISCYTVSRWKPSQEDWEEMAPLRQARSFFPLVVLDGLLYALGGRVNGVALDSVETYNPELNVWR